MRHRPTARLQRLLADSRPWFSVTAAGVAVFAVALLTASLPALAAAEKPYPEAGYTEDSETYAAAYSYLRIVDGEATLLQNTDERDYAEDNQPLLTGDRLFLSNHTRVEAILSDRTVVRLESKTQLGFDALGASPDATAEGTVLSLSTGEIQLTVPQDLLSELYPRIDTPNATVYIQEGGNYLITARRNGDSEVVVREGYAEIVTGRGSMIVHAEEEAVIEGQGLVRSSLYDARSYTSLERWADRLEREAQGFDGDVDPALRYSASSLSHHGTWLNIDGRRAWRPRVTVSWRPYYAGRWAYTPSGLTWVSSEPWGWVPYHYGSWDYVAHHGWVWYPGNRYAPAWVYWHWGNSYASWCPIGYYNTYYGFSYANLGLQPIFRWGLYGWSGGYSQHYDRWNFVDYENLGRHRQARFTRPGRELAAGRRDGMVERGIVTTDTRGLKPALLRRPGAAIEILQTRPTVDGRPAAALPDVTAFVARERLDGATEARVIARRVPRVDAGRVASIERPQLSATKPLAVSRPAVSSAGPRVRPAPAVTPSADRTPAARNTTPRSGQKPALSTAGTRRAPSVRVGAQPRSEAGGKRPAVAPRSTTERKPVAVPRAASGRVRRTPAAEKPAAEKPAAEKPPARNRVRNPRPGAQRSTAPRPSVRSTGPRPSVRPSVRPTVRPSVRPSVRQRPQASTPSAPRRESGQKPSVRSGSTPSRSPSVRLRSPRSPSPRVSKPQGQRSPQVRSQSRPAPPARPRVSNPPRPSSKRPAVRSGASSRRGGSSAPRARSGSGSSARPRSGGGSGARARSGSGGGNKVRGGSAKDGDGSGGKP